ncbi:MAG: hypothetical protein ACE5F1_08470 [Planctomycetota bacterium]
MSWRQAYRHGFGGLSVDEAFVIEQRMKSEEQVDDPLDDLIGAAPEQVRRWMRRCAMLADGGRVGVPTAGPESVLSAVEAKRSEIGPQLMRFGRRSASVWPLIETALLRELCAMTFDQIADRLGRCVACVSKRYRRHLKIRALSHEYESLVVGTAISALHRYQAPRTRVGGRCLTPFATPG